MTRNKPEKPFIAVSQPKIVPIQISQETLNMLANLSEKVMASKVLNGGFDAMMVTVAAMATKVDVIHDSVFDPDEGLFARIKDIDHIKANAVSIEKLSTDMVELQTWHKSEDRYDARETQISQENYATVKDHSDQLKDLISFKTRICTIIKWFAVTVGGGILTGLIKLVYDLAKGHIVIQ